MGQTSNHRKRLIASNSPQTTIISCSQSLSSYFLKEVLAPKRVRMPPLMATQLLLQPGSLGTLPFFPPATP